MTASDAAVVLFIFSVATVSADKQGVNSAAVQHTVLAVHSGNQRVDAVLVALAGVSLSLGTPVKTQIERLAAAMDQIESLAAEVRERSSVMQSQGDGYFFRWEQELAQLHDESSRARGFKRKQVVQAQFLKLRAGYMRVNSGLTQFLADLRVVRALLDHDLTPSAVLEIKSVSEKVTVSAPSLHESLAKLDEDFKSLGKELTFVGQPRSQ
ncbi:MAG: DUF2959 family protein [Opitutus sp.]|nr:DUF2959 family protein [Opitutus sp.]MCS6279110.1 DUF2959 family protein [Opitutus sp.]